ncbi:MAG: thiamine pyrophosphate-dependent enzyme, partial [Patescibacteria group bacterium]
HDVTVIVHDNGVYGLTTGQSAPTAQKGFKSKSTPTGILETPINPLALTITSGATFVAQSFAGDVLHTISMIKAGIEHKGFSLINILQPCVTFNKINTYQYYLQRVYKLDENYKKDDFKIAVQKSLETNEEKFPLGIIYQDKKPSYTDQLPQLNESTLLDKTRFTDFNKITKLFI